MNKKILSKKSVIKCVLLIFLLAFAIWFHIGASETFCYHYVEDLVYNCYISELDEYVKYSMLSSEIKQYIKKDDLKYTTDEELFSLAQKLQKIDYEYITDSESTYSTSSFKHGDLHKQINIDDKFYVVYFSITFAPNLFSSRPKIIRFEASLKEIKFPD